MLAEGLGALAAELQQRFALAIAQRVAADHAVVAIASGGDAVEGEPGPPCASQDPAGHVLRRGRGHRGLLAGVRRGVALVEEMPMPGAMPLLAPSARRMELMCRHLIRRSHMATNLALDQDLLDHAFRVSGEPTKKAAVTRALHEFIARREQRQVADLFGKLDWDPGYDVKAERDRQR